MAASNLTQDLVKLDRKLVKAYGAKTNDRDEDGVTSLVHTILSQNTTDRTSDRAFDSLITTFGGWEQVLAAGVSEVADSIRQGGLAEQKAASIKAVLGRIKQDFGSISIEALKGWPEDEVMSYLTLLKGVGPKTAACTMLFALGKKAFPVDTHVHRVANRLGLVTTKSAEETQKILTEAAPFSVCYSLHLNLIQHGRQRCHARKPSCMGCPIYDMCKSAGVN
ncbi:MAG TPA: endonuclease III [Bacillota bacterium]|nr:endonuclease III [Bacillota bacterium]HOG52416.1 endonuclease III [Bacillota bacterium]